MCARFESRPVLVAASYTRLRNGRDPEQVARFAAAKEALTKGSIENAKQLKQANAALK